MTARPEPAVWQSCPKCGDRDAVGTIEEIFGFCAHDNGEPLGYTEVWWDSTESIGILCKNCGHVEKWRAW